MPDDLIAADDATGDAAGNSAPGEYVVVARRYRPQSFVELVGQQHVAEALAGAIHSQRVGHAYLFTGARGVGKTSAARIFAKALDCVEGPTDKPCNQCDICRSITSGDDVDVIEIDGASNRGIDDIRQLRQNVNVRPSRARFKIYIIDEVHMLSRDAFNALLKTLEEPPEHVKFIFCTTEPEKIPITILSRCQRFDFAGIETTTIGERLRQITAAEGVAIEDEAVDLLARRAAGSMRDSQSLLEQILAAGGKAITVGDVQRLLGIAADTRMTALVDRLAARDAAGALGELDAAVRQGVDVGQLLDQLLGQLRDLMAAAVGCPPQAFLYASPSRAAEIIATAPRIGIHTLLAMLQIAEETAARLKQSTHGRTVVETALVRICCLEELDEIAGLIEQLNQGAPVGGGGAMTSGAGRTMMPAAGANVKKNIDAPQPLSGPAYRAAPAAATTTVAASATAVAPRPVNATTANVGSETTAVVAPAARSSSPQPATAPQPSSTAPTTSPAQPASTTPLPGADELLGVWERVCRELDDMLGENAGRCLRVSSSGSNRLVAQFAKRHNICKQFCERPDHAARLETALTEALGRPIKIEFQTVDEPAGAAAPPKPKAGPAPHEKLREKMQKPFVKKALELFDARAMRLEED